ncbi:MAG: sulfurtransferase [Cyanobacteria bacterium J06642_2]
MFDYSRPETLIDTQWLAEHLDDPAVRIVEVDMMPDACADAHIPVAVFWNILSDLMKPDMSMNFDLQQLLSQSGILPETTIVPYGSNPAASGSVFWLLKYFGHDNIRILNGGHQKWVKEGRPLSSELASVEPTQYIAPAVGDRTCQISAAAVKEALDHPNTIILDVRTLAEYNGEVFLNEPPEGSEQAGHIPGAVHLEHANVLNKDGTFKSAEALESLFIQHGISKDKKIIPYCAVGGRSGFIWFVLKYLLDYPDVQNYDGSWNEWSRLPNALIE